MPYAKKSIWVLTLLAFVAGCSGYQGLPGPNLPGEGVEGRTWPEDLELKDKVRVTLKDGRMVEGVVASLRKDSLILTPKSGWEIPDPTTQEWSEGEDPVQRTGTGQVSIPADQVQMVEKRGTDGGKTGLFILGVIVVGFGALVVAFAAGGGMGDMGLD